MVVSERTVLYDEILILINQRAVGVEVTTAALVERVEYVTAHAT
jgi:hypothetical protein